MAIFKEFSASDIKTNKSFLNQLVDVINTDISGSDTRKKYQVFVTGGVGPGVTSSLFQTVFDQDFTLQTANAVFDMTVGLSTGSQLVTDALSSIDANGKYLFPTNFVMMREKIDLYRLFAQELLGDSTATFTLKTTSDEINVHEALFICFKRLFARDQIKRETFAIKLHTSAAYSLKTLDVVNSSSADVKIFTDINSSTNKDFTFGGQVSTVVDSANTSFPVGLMFLDKGILVLDLSRSFDQNNNKISGAIDTVTQSGTTAISCSFGAFLMSASIDDIVDHIASTRFSGSGDETAIAFQNITNINSTLYFVQLAADEFNYSSNPTYTDSSGRIVVIDEGQEETQKSFTFITSVGLYDAMDNLLAVGKFSRPVLKESDRSLNFKLRLDY